MDNIKKCDVYSLLNFRIKSDADNLKKSLKLAVRHHVNLTERGLARDWWEGSAITSRLVTFMIHSLDQNVRAVSLFVSHTLCV
jgi:hypothetical protein